eukprot:TRINITY_DN19542_c0_g1_i1.p1 TRINITY_DN19542_c0_g1~~TRINITY_DN19542_c0_g1_i1.p1  ORF type:complete len:1339 (-),score=238.34 TRINITY_DN19542_c0_g1_i1:23-4039(-)
MRVSVLSGSCLLCMVCIFADASSAGEADVSTKSASLVAQEGPAVATTTTTPPISDPLVAFLRGLVLRPKDVQLGSTAGTIDLSNIVCEKVTIARIDSKFTRTKTELHLGWAFQDLGFSCSIDFKGKVLLLPVEGNLVATVDPYTAQDAPRVEAKHIFGLDDEGVPRSLSVQKASCNAVLDFNFEFKGGLAISTLNMLRAFLKPLVNNQVKSAICTQLSSVDYNSLLAKLNGVMLPPREAALSGVGGPVIERVLGETRDSSRSQGDAHAVDEGGSGSDSLLKTADTKLLDWTKVKGLELANTLVKALDPELIDRTIGWAFGGVPNMTIQGSQEPVQTQTIDLSNVGLNLNLEVYLKELSVEGVESVREIQSPVAQGPTNLKAGLKLGTKEEPNVGLGVRFAVKVRAEDTTGANSDVFVEEAMKVHLALKRPGLGATVRLALDEDAVAKKKSLGQWYSSAKGCALSLLAEVPKVEKLDVSFAGLGAPLTLHENTSGRLEKDLAVFIDNAITLFNAGWEPYIPGAVARFAGSASALTLINQEMADILKPGSAVCVSQKEIDIGKYLMHRTFSNWSMVFSEVAQTLSDRVIEGFLAQNNTIIDKKAVARVPKMSNELLDLNEEMDMAFNGGQLLGLSRIDSLKMLVPDKVDPSILTMFASAQCPTKEEPAVPTIVLDVGAGANGNVAQVVEQVRVGLPCGNVSASMKLSMNVWRAVDIPIPPSPYCLLAAVDELSIGSFVTNLLQEASLTIGPQHGGPRTNVVEEVCKDFPKVCDWTTNTLLQRVGHVKEINKFIASAMRMAQKECKFVTANPFGEEMSSGGEDATTLKAGRYGPGRDSEDFPFRDINDASISLPLIVAFVLLIAACSMPAPLLSKGKARVGNEDNGGAFRTPETPVMTLLHRERSEKVPMATLAWNGGTANGMIRTIIICSLLTIVFLGRTAGSWYLISLKAGITVDKSPFGSDIATVKLLRFTFFGTGKQFWEADLTFVTMLWYLSGVVIPLGVIGALLVLWLTPVLAAHRRTIIRSLIFLTRLMFQDLETYSLVKAALYGVVDAPGGIDSTVSLNAELGAYTHFVTTGCLIIALLCFLYLLPDPRTKLSSRVAVAAAIGGADVPPAEESGDNDSTMTIAKDVAAGCIVVGLILWMVFNFVYLSLTGVAGLLFDTAPYTGFTLLGAMKDPIMVAFMVWIFMLAPLGQAVMHLNSRLTGKPGQLQTLLRDVFDAFSALDIFTIAFFATFWPSVDQFVQVTLASYAEAICVPLSNLVGTDCAGVSLSVGFLGCLGLVVATLGSATIITVHTLQDIQCAKAAAAAQASLDNLAAVRQSDVAAMRQTDPNAAER